MKKQKTQFSQVLAIPSSYLQKKLVKTKLDSTAGQLIVFGQEDKEELSKLLLNVAPKWRLEAESFLKKEHFSLETENGPLWILCRRRPAGPFSHEGALEETEYSWFRDQGAWLISQFKASEVSQVLIQLRATSEEMERGLFVGLELAAYNYKNLITGKEFSGLPGLGIYKFDRSWDLSGLQSASQEGQAINLTRHLVNAPPNELNPVSLANFVKKEFPKSATTKVEVWDVNRLKKEKMGLHLGVGQGAEHAPCMIRIRHRPKVRAQKPIALVGKGVTFDTGGLDLKPSSAMRLMKKDMGGAAAVLGLAYFAAVSKLAVPADFYLGLAENSVDAKAMRPSDVLIARNGLQVEIHNTDAEGRLVLADVLDVAVTEKGVHEPELVINVATLTGAIKTALGTEIGGLFSNHDSLANEIEVCGSKAGDFAWRMPLYSRYAGSFSSPFADLVNAVDGWGGPITAALFLERFVRQKPWAHLDIYAWADKASGAMASSGGNGQSVQCLIEYLKSKKKVGRA